MATTDIVFGRGSILHLTKQLDSFRKKDLFLGRFRMLGRTERRRGGAEPSPLAIMQMLIYRIFTGRHQD
jgi:hypothetical protein